jgi:hypothetical protein
MRMLAHRQRPAPKARTLRGGTQRHTMPRNPPPPRLRPLLAQQKEKAVKAYHAYHAHYAYPKKRIIIQTKKIKQQL